MGFGVVIEVERTSSGAKWMVRLNENRSLNGKFNIHGY
jgi:hypothetical protein